MKKHKVKITKVPQYRSGGVTPGMSIGAQLNYGLYRGGLLKTNLQGTEQAQDEVRTTYPKADYKNGGVPNIEVEGRGKNKKGEKIIMPDMSAIYDFIGPTHENGGIPVNAQPNSYIMSDHITGTKDLQQGLGFTPASSNAKANHTWAKILDKKVPTKDYNRLSQILQMAATNKDVDPYELATAKNRFPGYQQYISRAILGNELSKASTGKDFSIPDMAMGEYQRMMGQEPNRQETSESEPMSEARYGGMYAVGGSTYEEDPFGPGDKIKRAQVEEYKKKGYQIDPNNPNRMIKPGSPAVTIQGGERTASGKSSITPEEMVKDKNKYPYLHKNYPGTTDEEKRMIAVYKLQTGRWPSYTKPGTDEDAIDIVDDNTPVTPTQPTTPTTPVTPTTPTTPGTTTQTTPTNTNSGITNKGIPPVEQQDVVQGVNGMGYPVRPFKEDLLDTAGAISDYYDRENIYPSRIRPTGRYMEPPFINERGYIANAQGSADMLAKAYGLYGTGAQGMASVLSGLQGNLVPQLQQIKQAVNEKNIASDFAARQYTSQVANQFGLADAATSNELMKDTDRLKYNIATSDALGREKYRAALRNMITNTGEANLYNYDNPQYAFDPYSYSPYFKQGTGRTDIFSDDSGSGGGAYGRFKTLKELNDYVEQETVGMDAEAKKEYRKYILDMEKERSKQRTPARPTRKARGANGAVSSYFKDSDLTPINPYAKHGGSFIPTYKTMWG
jgi:hypothetical protein